MSVTLPLAGSTAGTAFTYMQLKKRGADVPTAAWALATSGIISTIVLAVVLGVGAGVTGDGATSILGAVAVLLGIIPIAVLLISFRSPMVESHAERDRRTVVNRLRRNKIVRERPEARSSHRAFERMARFRLGWRAGATAVGVLGGQLDHRRRLPRGVCQRTRGSCALDTPRDHLRSHARRGVAELHSSGDRHRRVGDRSRARRKAACRHRRRSSPPCSTERCPAGSYWASAGSATQRCGNARRADPFSRRNCAIRSSKGCGRTSALRSAKRAPSWDERCDAAVHRATVTRPAALTRSSTAVEGYRIVRLRWCSGGP